MDRSGLKKPASGSTKKLGSIRIRNTGSCKQFAQFSVQTVPVGMYSKYDTVDKDYPPYSGNMTLDKDYPPYSANMTLWTKITHPTAVI